MKRFELRSLRPRLAASSLAAVVALGAAGCNDRPATPGEPRVASGDPLGSAVAASTGSTSAEACVTIQRGGGVGNVFDSGIDDNGVSSNNSSGTSSTIPIGDSGSPATPRQELLSFDLSPIPRGAGDTVVEAQVSLYFYPSSANQTINVHQATAAWSETTVSWPSFNEAFVAAPVTSFTTGAANPWNPLSKSPAAPNNTRFDLTSMVSGWLNNTVPNDGIVLEEAPLAGVSTIVLSSEWPPALSGYHPTLFVCFTVTCAAGTADCNDNGLDGCETNVTTAQNCGACGVACPAGATCQAGACVVGANACTNVVCSALDQCHTAGTCDPATGACSNPPAANGTGCNDGNACTAGDACQSGVCTGTAVTCTASDQCHAVGTCDPSTGACSNPPVADGTGCNDGNACTTGDACQSGVCTGSAVTCNALDQCHAAGTCDPSTGACSNPPVADGTSCNDGNACTTGDACQSGVCTGTAIACAASDACHAAGACDPATGACSNPTLADGSSCPGGTCQAGTCQTASCTDGIQNEGETGVDCGGPCPPCGLCTSTDTAVSATFSYLNYLTVDAQGDVWIADPGNSQVHEVTPGGQVLDFGSGQYGYADGPAASAQFSSPLAVAVDAQGNVFVADSGNAVIRGIAPDGTVSTVAGMPDYEEHLDGPALSAGFVYPTDLHFDSQGNLYIVDYSDSTVRKLDTSGDVTTIAGTVYTWGHVDGPEASAQFEGLEGITVDAQGNLYVTEYNEHDIRKIDTSGNVTTVAGVPGVAGARDGPAASALFDGLEGIAVDAQGDILVVDGNASTIRELTPGGVVSTIAGSAYNEATTDGCAAHLPLDYPVGIAVAGDGTIYFTDNTSLRTLASGGCDCTLPTCYDGIQNGGETGVDCGGPCPNACPTCSDGIQNEGELGIDCGGPCPLCAAGRECELDGACLSGVCRLRECQAPTCTDGVQNQGELSADCGGPCPLCAAGAACTVGAACTSTVCTGGVCSQATCADGIQNQGELSVDCGGPCPLCGAGTACTVGAACASGVCTGGSCQAPTCFDGVQNGGEIDVDCGGACGPCPVGEHCITGTDCASGVCQGNVCRSTTCGDGVRDGSETDVDCGGPSCVGCASGQMCGTAADCASNRCVGGVCNPPPVPPANDPTVPTGVARSTAFLYSGASPVQTNVAPTAIDARRVGVVRGQVVDRNSAPIPDVAVSVLGHPELGVTYTRANGAFDLAANGGGPATLVYQKPGLISAQRVVVVPWLDFVAAPTVAMIGLDAAVTSIDMTNEDATQVARGSVVTDHDGTRQATAMFAPGTTATMVLPDGTRRQLTSISLRATEFTVGPLGAQTMPAPLPLASGYTYAVDMSADQAVLAGATSLVFNQPVAVYVEDFLNFPVGQVVPVGYYDPTQGDWVASENGLIVQVLDVAGGLADLDIDGSGTAASADALTSLGVTAGELTQLASLYAPGTNLWRSPSSHFSLIDDNWPYGFPPGATPPPDPNNPPPKPDCNSAESGSIIDCESQVLGEQLTVEGTPFKLQYSTESAGSRAIDFTLSGATVPSSLKRIDLLISVAGESQTLSFSPTPNQTYHYVWDGNDGYGRPVTGAVQPTANLHYVYPMVYYAAPSAYYASFAQFPGVSFQSSTTWGGELVYTGDAIGGRDYPGQEADEIFSNVDYPTPVLQGNDTSLGLGGWTLDAHQSYQAGLPGALAILDAPHPILQISSVIGTVAGGGGADPVDSDGGPAVGAALSWVPSVAAAPDGSFYIVDQYNSIVRHVTPDGLIHTIAGCGSDPSQCAGTWVAGGGYGYGYGTPELAVLGGGAGGDGGGENDSFSPTTANSCLPTSPVPCTATSVSIVSPVGVAVGPDGSVYIADAYGAVYRVYPNGTLVTVAGVGNWGGYSGDGGPALSAMISPTAIAVGADGSLYIAEAYNYRVRRVGPEGIITTVAGDGSYAVDGDGGAAIVASIASPYAVALGPDGSLYIAAQYYQSGPTGSIRRVGLDGRIYTVVGNGQPVFWWESNPDLGGTAALSAAIVPESVTVAADGSIYFDSNYRVYRLGPTGSLVRVAGDGTSNQSGDGGLATASQLVGVQALSVGPDGTLRISSYSTVRSVAPFAPTVTIAPASWNLQSDVTFYPLGDVVYVFDSNMRHVRTVDRTSERTIYVFAYDANGQLSTVTGAYGDVTQITRDGSGNPTAIVGPGGQRTTLALGADTYLASVTTPAGDAAHMIYAANGLLTQYTDLRGGAHLFTYDANSRLVDDQNAIGGYTTLTRTDLPNGYVVSTTTALGRVKLYNMTNNPDGSLLRTVTDERGGITSTFVAVNGTTTLTQPDGTTVVTSLAPDPVWGMVAPVTAQQVTTTPDGTSLTLTRTVSSPYTGTGDPASASRLETITSGADTWTQAWDGNARTFTQLTPSAQSSLQYDLYGRVASMVQTDLASGASQTTTRTYDGSGLLVSLVSPAGSWTFTHDSGFRLTSRTDAVGNTTAIAYDTDGRPASLTQPNGEVTSIGYDASDNVISRISVGATTSYAYDLENHLLSKVEPDSSQVTFTYDVDGRAAGKLDSTGGSVAYTLDAADNRVREDIYDAGGSLRNTIQRTFDARNRVTGTTSGAGQTTSYGYAVGELSTVTDGLGDQTVYTYDPNDVLTQLTDGADETTSYAFNDASSLQTVTDARGVSTLAQYDGLGNYLATVSPDTGATNYTYDSTGRVTSRTDGRGVARTYAHDAAGRFTSLGYSTGAPGVTFTYDQGANGQGMLTGIAEASGNTSYGYDAQGHVVEEDRTIGGQTWSITRTYNAAGWITSVAVIPGGATIAYAYDANGRVTQITASDGQGSRTLVSGVTYLPFGPLEGMTLGNGVAVSRAYDAAYRLTRLTAGAVVDRSYAYDAAGNLTSIVDGVAPGNSETFAYDAAKRLVDAQGAYGEEAYAYDAVGDRTSIARSGAVDTYTYGANNQQLLGITGSTSEGYAYDGSGNATTAGGLTLTYDENNHLASASSDGQLLATYQSSVIGHRVTKTDAAGNVTVYLYDGQKLLATADGNGNLLDQQVYLQGTRVAVLHRGAIDDADVSFVVNDHRSAPAVLLDPSANVVWAGTYRPFGEVSVSAGTVTNDLRLPGQIYDAETGLYDNYLRTYDPRTGRFLESDPSGLEGGMATYSYAAQGPILFVDPLGLGSINLSFYDGIGGGISISWGSKGFSTCAEVGVGAGFDAGFSPTANAEPSHAYGQVSAKVTAGPYSEEVNAGIQSSPCGPQLTAGGSVSVGPFSVGQSGTAPLSNPTQWETEPDTNVSLDPKDWQSSSSSTTSSEEGSEGDGVEAKAVVGACHNW